MFFRQRRPNAICLLSSVVIPYWFDAAQLLCLGTQHDRNRVPLDLAEVAECRGASPEMDIVKARAKDLYDSVQTQRVHTAQCSPFANTKAI